MFTLSIEEYYGTTVRSTLCVKKKNYRHIISDNVCTKIDVLHNLINIREGNISCDGFTREEINFMIYDICFLLNICTIFNTVHILHAMYLYA